MQRKQTDFMQEANDIFKSYLSETRIMIKDKTTGKVLENISYKNVLFDSNMNFYKIVEDEIQRVENPNFEVVIIKNGNILE